MVLRNYCGGSVLGSEVQQHAFQKNFSSLQTAFGRKFYPKKTKNPLILPVPEFFFRQKLQKMWEISFWNDFWGCNAKGLLLWSLLGVQITMVYPSKGTQKDFFVISDNFLGKIFKKRKKSFIWHEKIFQKSFKMLGIFEDN